MRGIQSVMAVFLLALSGAFVWQHLTFKNQINIVQKENQEFRDRLAKLDSISKPTYQVVQQRDVVAPTTTANVHVECPPGMKVLGGGFSIETPNDVKVFHSIPSDGNGNLIDHGWNVFVQNAGSSSRQTTAVGICVSAE